MTATFTLADVEGHYAGVRVVGPISLTIASGEQIALVAQSGAGVAPVNSRGTAPARGRGPGTLPAIRVAAGG